MKQRSALCCGTTLAEAFRFLQFSVQAKFKRWKSCGESCQFYQRPNDKDFPQFLPFGTHFIVLHQQAPAGSLAVLTCDVSCSGSQCAVELSEDLKFDAAV